MKPVLKLGLLINPYAGLGGPVALKGSDGPEIRDRALAEGAHMRAAQRAARCLSQLVDVRDQIHFVSCPGVMGADLCVEHGLSIEVIDIELSEPSTAEDTKKAAELLLESDIDLLLFAGGDGTARDVLDVVGDAQPVLGIPCGVKMHSGVFAVSPEAAGEILKLLSQAGLVDIKLREVRDIDESAFRDNRVKTAFYGEMLAPEVGGFLQHTKISGVESDELVAQDIAEEVVEHMSEDTLYVLGPGSTTLAVIHQLGLEGTLLGVDVIYRGEILLRDANAQALLDVAAQHTDISILVSPIGGQGHVLGRGNQQISPELLRLAGLENLVVLAGKGKIASLEGRPLLVDSNDPQLDQALSGYHSVITGYQDRVLYPVAALPE